MNTAKEFDIYICSSIQDIEIASHIQDQLSAEGIRCFFDKTSIASGHDFMSVIVDSIKSSKLVLYLCSDSSSQSRWITNEILFALKNHIIVVPILVDNATLSNEMEFALGRQTPLVYNRSSGKEDTTHIVSKVKFLLKIMDTVKLDATELNLPKGIVSHHTHQHKQNCTTPELIGPPHARNQEPSRSKTINPWWIFLIFIISFFLGLAIVNSDKFLNIGLALLIFGGLGAFFALLAALPNNTTMVTLYCETEKRGHSKIFVYVDNRQVASITGEGVAKFRVSKGGKYLISIKSADSDLEVEKFEYDTNKETSGDIKYVTLKKHSETSPVQKSTDTSDITNYRCFIAGSTRLVNERNATRAVLSILYNKWEKYKLVISSYTFEDFSNGYTVGGQQIQYNEFIQDIADCTIFIVENGVGDETLKEYKLAIATFKNNLKRPKVYVYANNLNNDSTTLTFIEEVRRNRSYWREYSNISELMSKIKEDIDAELFNIFVINNKHS